MSNVQLGMGWLAYTNRGGERVAIAIRHIAEIGAEAKHLGPAGSPPVFGLSVIMVNEREIFIRLDVASLEDANQVLDKIIREIR